MSGPKDYVFTITDKERAALPALFSESYRYELDPYADLLVLLVVVVAAAIRAGIPLVVLLHVVGAVAEDGGQ